MNQELFPKRGKLFVFEGPDGAGKSTLIDNFLEKLNQEGIPCVKLAFPGNIEGTLGKDIYDLHHRASSRIYPTSLQILHIAAHIEAIEWLIIPSLEKGTCVILDRYWWSTWVYGMIDGANPVSLKQMIEVEKIHWKGIQPSALFLVQRHQPLRVETTDERWQSLANKYSDLAAKEKGKHPIFLINNQGCVEDAGREIYSHALISFVENRFETQQSKPMLKIHKKLSPAKPTEVFRTYWYFAAERQRIFFNRFRGELPPWTDDLILREHKFTNAYRASDRVSQYLIRYVIYSGDQSCDEVFYRILLFKLFNKIETWQLIKSRLGEISFRDHSFERLNEIFDDALRSGVSIYSAAYIMPTGERGKYARKHSMHLKLLEKMMNDELPSKIAESRSMAAAFDLLREYPTIGDFLAYQFITDLNYSQILNFSEMDFVVPGPGARDGIKKCFSDTGGLTDGELIRVVTELQEKAFEELDIEFQTLWGRKLQLIDCQNLFCEVDKYSRKRHPEISGLSGRTRIKQRYLTNPSELDYWYPPKWGLNEQIECMRREFCAGRKLIR